MIGNDGFFIRIMEMYQGKIKAFPKNAVDILGDLLTLLCHCLIAGQKIFLHCNQKTKCNYKGDFYALKI